MLNISFLAYDGVNKNFPNSINPPQKVRAKEREMGGPRKYDFWNLGVRAVNQ